MFSETSIFLNHNLGGFDNSGDGVAFLELEFVSAAARDDALNKTVPDPNDNVSHDIAELNLFNFSAQFVSS
jgi:hypothetical protein